METIFNDKHVLHQSPGELMPEGYVPAFEKPERAEFVLNRVKEVKLGAITRPNEHELADITRVHDVGMVELLRTGAAEWAALGHPGGAIPFSWAARGMREDRIPRSLHGRLSYYCFDAATPLTATSWEAIKASADTALTAATKLGEGANSIFALCRPPGHHAGADHYGGYCFLNNAAIAAQKLRDNGAERIAILDVDYHHGNGTQQIFYERNDVLVVNLHGDPDYEYPFRLGFADENGKGAGEGFNLNLPLPPGTAWAEYEPALRQAMARITAFAPDVLVVSLGVDTYKGDPISHFKLEHEDYTRIVTKAVPIRHGRRLCRGGNRHQYRKCPDRFLGRVICVSTPLRPGPASRGHGSHCVGLRCLIERSPGAALQSLAVSSAISRSAVATAGQDRPPTRSAGARS